MLRDGSIEGASVVEGVGGGAWMEVEREPDHGGRCDQLHRTLKRIVKARGSLDLQEAAALREAQQIKIWRRFGYNSLIEYMELEMGYSPRAAVERLRVANALPQLPQIAAAIEQGDLSFSGARELTRVETTETEEKWLGATAEMNVREVEAAVSGHTRGDLPTDPPDPKLVRKVLATRCDSKQMSCCARRSRSSRRSAASESMRMLRSMRWRCSMCSGGSGGRVATAANTARTSALAGANEGDVAESAGAVDMQQGAESSTYDSRLDHGGAPYRVAVTLCKECKRGWLHGAGTVSLMSPGAVEAALCDAQHIGDLDSPIVERAKQDIPPAMRRKVKHRDKGRCRVPGCRSSLNVDIHHLHHLIPVSKGGTHAYDQLVTLCEGHHIAHHEGALHITVNAATGELTVKREGRNQFTRTKRAVDATASLRASGYSKEAVRAAIERTKAHVGTGDVSLEQWIELAMRYLGDQKPHDRPSA